MFVLVFVYDINKREKNKALWYYIVLIILILLAGLRYRLGVDTVRYIYSFYHIIPRIDGYSISSFIGAWHEPLFSLLNKIVYDLGGKFWIVQLICAFITNVLLFKFFKRNSRYLFSCILLYFIWVYSDFNAEEVRAGIAYAICLYSNDLYLKRKWLKATALVILACGFHSSAVIVLITPILMNLRLNFLSVSIILVSLVVGYYVKEHFSSLVYALSYNENLLEKAQDYAGSYYVDNDRNIFFYIANALPIYACSLISLIYCKKNTLHNYFIRYESFLLLGLIFFTLSNVVFLFYRMVHFYVVYFILFYVEYILGNATTLYKNEKSPRLLNSVVVLSMVLFTIFLKYNSTIDSQTKVWDKYYPYSSVIERSVSKERESAYSFLLVPDISDDEY